MKPTSSMYAAENVRLSVRQHGPMTIPEIASVLRWNARRTARAVKIASGYRWITIIAKQPSGHFVYGAVQPIEERYERREISPSSPQAQKLRWLEGYAHELAAGGKR